MDWPPKLGVVGPTLAAVGCRICTCKSLALASKRSMSARSLAVSVYGRKRRLTGRTAQRVELQLDFCSQFAALFLSLPKLAHKSDALKSCSVGAQSLCVLFASAVLTHLSVSGCGIGTRSGRNSDNSTVELWANPTSALLFERQPNETQTHTSRSVGLSVGRSTHTNTHRQAQFPAHTNTDW